MASDRARQSDCLYSVHWPDGSSTHATSGKISRTTERGSYLESTCKLWFCYGVNNMPFILFVTFLISILCFASGEPLLGVLFAFATVICLVAGAFIVMNLLFGGIIRQLLGRPGDPQ
jgi:hypothetical protein